MSREAMTLTIKNSLLGMRLFFSLDYFGWFIYVAQEKKECFFIFYSHKSADRAAASSRTKC